MASTERKFVLVNNKASHIDGCVVMSGDTRKTVILYPGHNEVTPELWVLVAANPVMKDKIASGKIKKYDKSFFELPEENSAEVVLETSDPRLLKIWKEKESRPLVRTTIEDALKKIFGEKYKEV